MGIRLKPEKTVMQADGHDVIYVGIELTDKDGHIVPDAQISLHAEFSGFGKIAGFGSANPITEENYTDCDTVSFRGRSMAIIRSGYEKGNGILRISAEGIQEEVTEISVI